jgi:gliding motility-associated-like protein
MFNAVKKLFTLVIFICSTFVLYSQNGIRYFSGINSVNLGNGNTTSPAYYDSFQRIISDSNWLLIQSGEGPVAGLRKNGTIWVWGDNSQGSLGTGNYTTQYYPKMLGTDSGWKKVDIGTHHMVAIDRLGRLWAWGYNNVEQLGTGDNKSYNVPQLIDSNTNWIDISTTYAHTLALKKDGTLWSWGYNPYGQVGHSTATGSNTPKQIGSDTDWVEISTGYHSSMAIKRNGSLWAWGYNYNGQLGLGNSINQSTPQMVGSSFDWRKISCGFYFFTALKKDGSLYAWGDQQSSNSPTKISSDTWQCVSSAYEHSLAININGYLYSWGKNSYGQLGLKNKSNYTTPQQVDKKNKFCSVSAGYYHSFAIQSNCYAQPIPGPCKTPIVIYYTNNLKAPPRVSFINCNTDSLVVKIRNSNYKYAIWNDGSKDSIRILKKTERYIISATDFNGCISKDTLDYQKYEKIKLSIKKIDSVSCFNLKDGNIEIIINGGIKPFNILWNDPNKQTTSKAINLGFGKYSIFIKDSAFCIDSSTISINQPEKLKLDIFTIDSLNCLSNSTGSIGVIAKGGNGTFKYQWNDNNRQVSQKAVNLKSGTYKVVVTDQKKCQDSLSIILPTADKLIVEVPKIDSISCYGIKDGAVYSRTTGGDGNYNWTWNTTPPVYSKDLKNIGAGKYCLTVRDIKGCKDSICITIYEPDQIKTKIISPLRILPNSPINLNSQVAPTGNYFYSWFPLDIFKYKSHEIKPEATFQTNTWVKLLINDSNNCTSQDSILLEVIKPISRLIPTAYSPNADGLNDKFGLPDIFEILSFEIYNRWGEMIFQGDKYNPKWDGKYQNSLVLAGAYTYFIKAKLIETGQVDSYLGNVIIIR